MANQVTAWGCTWCNGRGVNPNTIRHYQSAVKKEFAHFLSNGAKLVRLSVIVVETKP